MNKVSKILIRFPNWLGDMVMALPLVEALKNHYPNATIHALVKAPFQTVLKDHPDITKIHQLPPSSFIKKWLPSSLAKVLKKQSYDLALVCTHSFSSGWLIKQAKIPVRIGRARFLGKWLLSHRVFWNKNEHQRQQYLSLLEPLGLKIKELKGPLRVLESNDFKTPKPYILLHPGASYGSAKTWPLAYYEKLSLMICEQLNLPVIFLGDISQAKPHLTHPLQKDLSGKTTLNELLILIKNSALIICNDSGPMHLADALGTPLIALFGATDPVLTGPISPRSKVLFNKMPCGPCFKRVCPIEHPCMKTLMPDAVFKALISLIQTYGTP